MSFNKGNVRSWNKKGPTFQIFRLRRAHDMSFNKRNVRLWKKINLEIFYCYCIIDKHERGAEQDTLQKNPNRNFF